MTKQSNIKLTPQSTVFYREDEDGFPLYANVRDGDTIRKYRLDHSFVATWQSAKTRHIALEQGELDPAKWKLISEVNLASTGNGDWTPPAI